MQFKKTTFLVIVLLIFSYLAKIDESNKQTQEHPNQARIFEAIDFSSVKIIDFPRKGFTLNRRGTRWANAKNQSQWISQDKVKRFVQALQGISILEEAQNLSSLKSEIKMHPPTLALASTENNPLIRIYLGERTVARFGVYVYDSHRESVYIGSAALDILLNKTIDDFREHRIYQQLDPLKFQSLTIKSSKWDLSFQLYQGDYYLRYMGRRYAVRRRSLEEVFLAISSLNVVGFVDSKSELQSNGDGISVAWNHAEHGIGGFKIFLTGDHLSLLDQKSLERYLVHPNVVLHFTRGIEYFVEKSQILGGYKNDQVLEKSGVDKKLIESLHLQEDLTPIEYEEFSLAISNPSAVRLLSNRINISEQNRKDAIYIIDEKVYTKIVEKDQVFYWKFSKMHTGSVGSILNPPSHEEVQFGDFHQ